METASAHHDTPRVAYLSADDLRMAASVLFNAYRDDPFFRAVFPTEDYDQRLRAAIREELQELWQRHQLLVGLFIGDSLVGLTSLLDHQYPQGQTRYWNWRLKMALGTGWASARQWMAREEEIRDIVSMQQYLLLQFIAVAPQYQHQGYGALLLSAVNQLAMERPALDGVVTLVYEAAHRPLFEQRGFLAVKDVHVGQVTGTLMAYGQGERD